MFRSVLTSKTKTTDFLECRLRVGLRNWTNLEYFIDLVWTSKSKKKRRTLDIISISDIISAWASKQERNTDLGYYIGLDFKQERIFFRMDFSECRQWLGLRNYYSWVSNRIDPRC
ncbi:unnamed protein product [Rhizophagus irregularis]|nr:unnamed protein product [Rhizophagus irregularis]